MKPRPPDRIGPDRKTEVEPLAYLAGFGNDLTSEALPGALPIDQDCVRKPPYGLYHEVINATSFIAPRKYNQRMHFYRLRPSDAVLTPCDSGQFVSAPLRHRPNRPRSPGTRPK